MTYERGEAGKTEDQGSGRGKDDLGYVYFAGAVGGPIKIGRSLRPHERLSSLRCGSDRDLLLLATLPGGRELEAKLHKRFAAHRIRGEVFAASPDLLMLIWSIAAGEPRQFNQQVPVDAIARFLADRTARDLDSRVRSSLLYAAFEAWCGDQGEGRWTQTAFSGALRRAGFLSKRSNGMQWLGLRMIDVEGA